MTSDLPPGGSIAIVGNAPETRPCAARVNAAEHVVRFNNPAGFGGATGSKVSEMFLVNCGGQMRQWLAENRLRTAPCIGASRCVSLPIHPDVDSLFADTDAQPNAPVDPDGINYAAEASAVLRDAGKHVRIVPFATFCACCAALGIERLGDGAPVPSTGMLALFDIVQRAAPDTRIDVFGFGFAGWEGHDWQAEQAWATAAARQGRLCLHPV